MVSYNFVILSTLWPVRVVQLGCVHIITHTELDVIYHGMVRFETIATFVIMLYVSMYVEVNVYEAKRYKY